MVTDSIQTRSWANLAYFGLPHNMQRPYWVKTAIPEPLTDVVYTPPKSRTVGQERKSEETLAFRFCYGLTRRVLESRVRD